MYRESRQYTVSRCSRLVRFIYYYQAAEGNKKKAQHPALLVGGIGHKGNIPSPFHGPGHLPLVPGTIARYPPGQQFTPFADKTPQPSNIFIIYMFYFIHTKTTHLAFPTTIPCHIRYHPSLGKLKG